MEQVSERRTENRFRYSWPVWFSSEPHHGEVSQGQMVDITSNAAAFTCYADCHCPHPSQYLATRFSVPRYGEDGSFDMSDFVRTGHVYRVDSVSDHLRRVVVRFSESLPFHPATEEEEAVTADSLEPTLV